MFSENIAFYIDASYLYVQIIQNRYKLVFSLIIKILLVVRWKELEQMAVSKFFWVIHAADLKSMKRFKWQSKRRIVMTIKNHHVLL